MQCFTEKQALEYESEYEPSLNLIIAQNYVDFDDIDNPLKK